MVSTRKKKQSMRRLLSQLDDSDRDNIIGNIVSDRHKNATINEGIGDQELTVDNSGINLAARENMVIVKILDRCFNERIDRERGSIVDDLEDRI